MNVIEQLTLFDLGLKTEYEIDEELYQNQIEILNNWVFNQSKEIKLIYYAIYPVNYLIKNNLKSQMQTYKDSLTRIADSLTYHFANLAKDIYIYSFKVTNGYYRCYQVKGRILVENHSCNSITDEIYFPAMCIKMFDNTGNPIHFSNRDDFVMNDLGFAKIGQIRDPIFKERCFATLKVTWWELVDYLGGKNDTRT